MKLDVTSTLDGGSASSGFTRYKQMLRVMEAEVSEAMSWLWMEWKKIFREKK
jgi:hypothetical protein